jgi:hypothetical protein
MNARYKSLLGAVAVLLGFSGSANSAVVVTAVESGGDVIFTTEAGGSLDLSGSAFWISSNGSTFLNAATGSLGIGGDLAGGNPVNLYLGLTGDPFGPGTGGDIVPEGISGSGDYFGFSGADNFFFVPDGYVSGDPLSGTSTFAGESFTTLGMSQGSYVYTLTGSGDTITLNVVPIPAAVWLFGSALVGLGWMRRKQDA